MSTVHVLKIKIPSSCNFSNPSIRKKKVGQIVNIIVSHFLFLFFFSFSFPRYPRGRRQLARGHREKILGCRYDSILVPARVSITDSVKLTDAAAVFRPLKLIGESALPALPDSANVASTPSPSEDASVC